LITGWSQDGYGTPYLFYFRDYNDEGDDYYTSYTLHHAKIWTNDNLVRWFVPQPDGTLLDLVNGETYCNQNNCGVEQLSVSTVYE
jgi:hypothetical protein